MIPKLRFPEFTDNWTVTELGECSDIQTGKALPSSDILEFGDRLICRGINVKSGFLESNSEINRFTNSFIDRKYLVQNDDILLPMDGSKVGKNIAVADLEFHNSFLIQRVARIRLPKELVWFYFQQLWSWNFERYVFTINTSSGIPHISEKQIRRFKVSKPSLEEAHKISSLFELVNKKINLLTKKKEALETYKKGLMQKIFSQELRFKREDGTYYPEWKKVTLGSTCKVLRGKGLPKSVISKDGLYKCIHYGELFTYYGEVIAFVNSFTDNREGTLSQFGDVLMPSSDVTPYGLMTASMVQEDNVCLGGDINVVRPNQTIDCEVYSWDSAFLSFYLNSIPKVLMRLISGTTVKHLYTSDLKGVELWQPTKKEQELCSRLFLSINSKIKILEKELFAIHNLKKGLLQQMFV